MPNVGWMIITLKVIIKAVNHKIKYSRELGGINYCECLKWNSLKNNLTNIFYYKQVHMQV